jgi:uncharacterized protein YkwD
MAGESRPSIVQRVGSEPVRAAALRIGAIISVAALVAFAMYAVLPQAVRRPMAVPPDDAPRAATVGTQGCPCADFSPSTGAIETSRGSREPPTAQRHAIPYGDRQAAAARRRFQPHTVGPSRWLPTQAPAPPLPTSTPRGGCTCSLGLDTSPMDAYAQALFDDTNRRRIGAGLPPLRANGWLVGIARLRSQDMAEHHYFAHVSPITGDNAFTLMDKHGVPYGWAGENLAENNYPLADAVAVADASLWNSPPHRENILGPNYTDVGIALVVDSTRMNYFTIIFTGPP